jgi:hypothetical protein
MTVLVNSRPAAASQRPPRENVKSANTKGMPEIAVPTTGNKRGYSPGTECTALTCVSMPAKLVAAPHVRRPATRRRQAGALLRDATASTQRHDTTRHNSLWCATRQRLASSVRLFFDARNLFEIPIDTANTVDWKMKAALAGVHAIPETNEAVYFVSVASACPICVVGGINSGIAYLDKFIICL